MQTNWAVGEEVAAFCQIVGPGSYFEQFVSAGCSMYQLDGTFRYAQGFGQQRCNGLVGFAFFWRSCNTDVQETAGLYDYPLLNFVLQPLGVARTCRKQISDVAGCSVCISFYKDFYLLVSFFPFLFFYFSICSILVKSPIFMLIKYRPEYILG